MDLEKLAVDTFAKCIIPYHGRERPYSDQIRIIEDAMRSVATRCAGIASHQSWTAAMNIKKEFGLK